LIARTGPMLGFKVFDNAAITIAGVELQHRIRKGQFALGPLRVQGRTAPDLAASMPRRGSADATVTALRLASRSGCRDAREPPALAPGGMAPVLATQVSTWTATHTGRTPSPGSTNGR
jgi:hypothetical protein